MKVFGFFKGKKGNHAGSSMASVSSPGVDPEGGAQPALTLKYALLVPGSAAGYKAFPLGADGEGYVQCHSAKGGPVLDNDRAMAHEAVARSVQEREDILVINATGDIDEMDSAEVERRAITGIDASDAMRLYGQLAGSVAARDSEGFVSHCDNLDVMLAAVYAKAAEYEKRGGKMPDDDGADDDDNDGDDD